VALRGIPKRMWLASAAGLLGLLAIDLAGLTRASGVSAAGCVAVVVRPAADAREVVERYHDVIVEQARIYDLPPELIAAVIANHQSPMRTRRRLTDCVGSALGADLSLGLAQVRLSTAAGLDGTSFAALSAPDYRTLRAHLLSPESNIAYQARTLRALPEQDNRYPGMTADPLIADPAVMALLVTEYRMGPLGTPRDQSRRSAAAFGALTWIQNVTLGQFGRDPDAVLQIRSRIRDYLRYINCESGIFNEKACDAWKRRDAGGSS